jgi:hypothetical protein
MTHSPNRLKVAFLGVTLLSLWGQTNLSFAQESTRLSRQEFVAQPPTKYGQPLGQSIQPAPNYGAPLDQSLQQPKYGAPLDQSLQQPKYGAPLDQSLQQPKYGAPLDQSLQQPAQPTQPNTTGDTTPQPGLTTPADQVAPPMSLIDLSSASFGKLTIDLSNAQFKESSIDRGQLVAQDMDFRRGILRGLSMHVFGGRFEQFIFDEMLVNTSGDLQFNPQLLLTDKILQFSTPAQADILVTVSQASLNQFLDSPKTLEKISVTASKRIGALASLFGAGGASIGLQITNAQVVLAKGNKIIIDVKANVGMAGVGVPLSFQIDAKLGIKDGWVEVTDTHLITNGQELSPQLSEMLVRKINSLASWGQKSDDIKFQFTDVKVLPNKQFAVKGTALISRLRMSRAKEETAPGNQGMPGNQGLPNTPGIQGGQGQPNMQGMPAVPSR